MQRLSELLGLFAARLSHGGLAASASPDNLGNLADQLTRVHTLVHQVIVFLVFPARLICNAGKEPVH